MQELGKHVGSDLPYTTSFWSEGRSTEAAPLVQDLDADVAVIGGGFVGLSSAYALLEAEPSLRVVVLEAEHVGFGASGRGSGMVAPLLHGIPSVARIFGWDEVRWAARCLIAEGANLKDFIRKESIHCEYQDQPLATVAIDGRQAEWISARTEELRFAGYSVDILERERLRDFVCYPATAGMLIKDENFGGLQPFLLAQGFADAAVRRGARLYGNTKVERCEVRPQSIQIITEHGASVKAQKLVVATGARTRELGWGRFRPFPMAVHSYLLATEALDQSTLSRLGAGLRDACVLDASHAFYYLRTYHNSLLIGGAAALFSKGDEAADRDIKKYEIVRAELHRRFPFLRATPLAAAWAGPIQSNLSELPTVRVDPESPNVILNIAYVNGVPLSYLAGRMIVDLVLGDSFADPDVQRLRSIFNGTNPSVPELVRFAWRLFT